MVRNPACLPRRRLGFDLGWEEALGEGVASQPGLLAGRIPGTEEPAGLRSLQSPRAGHDLATEQQQPTRKTNG